MMVDLNLWQLAYDDVLLEFGTHESGHPFTEQVKVGPADRETDDLPHPLSDGLVFGQDRTRGRLLEFTGAHLSTMPHPITRRWVPVMDDSGVFEQAWRADAVRAVRGKVAILANVDRGRLVYGRPRPYAPDHAKARDGWLTYACSFATIDDRFYSTTEQVVISGVEPGSATVFTFPLTFPHAGTSATDTRAWVQNAGTADSWPVVTFRGGGNPRLDLLNDMGGVLWSLEVQKNLGSDQEMMVDTHPWRRAVELNGSPAPGLLRGSRLDEARIPPGLHELRMVAVDPTGLAEVEVRWRDAFGSL
jgi:hypothetical protein